MEIKQLNKLTGTAQSDRLINAHTQFEKLLSELKKKELTDDIIIFINNEIDKVNTAHDKELRKQIRKSQTFILKTLEKELKIVIKNYYRNLWMAVGMAVFGTPLGVAFGTAIGNMAMLGVGLPIGMVIGLAIGTNMDKKAFKEGRQLDVEINY